MLTPIGVDGQTGFFLQHGQVQMMAPTCQTMPTGNMMMPNSMMMPGNMVMPNNMVPSMVPNNMMMYP